MVGLEITQTSVGWAGGRTGYTVEIAGANRMFWSYEEAAAAREAYYHPNPVATPTPPAGYEQPSLPAPTSEREHTQALQNQKNKYEASLTQLQMFDKFIQNGQFKGSEQDYANYQAAYKSYEKEMWDWNLSSQQAVNQLNQTPYANEALAAQRLHGLGIITTETYDKYREVAEKNVQTRQDVINQQKKEDTAIKMFNVSPTIATMNELDKQGMLSPQLKRQMIELAQKNEQEYQANLKANAIANQAISMFNVSPTSRTVRELSFRGMLTTGLEGKMWGVVTANEQTQRTIGRFNANPTVATIGELVREGSLSDELQSQMEGIIAANYQMREFANRDVFRFNEAVSQFQGSPTFNTIASIQANYRNVVSDDVFHQMEDIATKQNRINMVASMPLPAQLTSTTELFQSGILSKEDMLKWQLDIITTQAKQAEAGKLNLTPTTQADINAAQIAVNLGIVTPEWFKSYKAVAEQNILTGDILAGKAVTVLPGTEINLGKWGLKFGDYKIGTYQGSQSTQAFKKQAVEVFYDLNANNIFEPSESKGIFDLSGQVWATQGMNPYLWGSLVAMPGGAEQQAGVFMPKIQLRGLSEELTGGAAKAKLLEVSDYMFAKGQEQGALKSNYLGSPTAIWSNQETFSDVFFSVNKSFPLSSQLLGVTYIKPTEQQLRAKAILESPTGQWKGIDAYSELLGYVNPQRNIGLEESPNIVESGLHVDPFTQFYDYGSYVTPMGTQLKTWSKEAIPLTIDTPLGSGINPELYAKGILHKPTITESIEQTLFNWQTEGIGTAEPLAKSGLAMQFYSGAKSISDELSKVADRLESKRATEEGILPLLPMTLKGIGGGIEIIGQIPGGAYTLGKTALPKSFGGFGKPELILTAGAFGAGSTILGMYRQAKTNPAQLAIDTAVMTAMFGGAIKAGKAGIKAGKGAVNTVLDFNIKYPDVPTLPGLMVGTTTKPKIKPMIRGSELQTKPTAITSKVTEVIGMEGGKLKTQEVIETRTSGGQVFFKNVVGQQLKVKDTALEMMGIDLKTGLKVQPQEPVTSTVMGGVDYVTGKLIDPITGRAISIPKTTGNWAIRPIKQPVTSSIVSTIRVLKPEVAILSKQDQAQRTILTQIGAHISINKQEPVTVQKQVMPLQTKQGSQTILQSVQVSLQKMFTPQIQKSGFVTKQDAATIQIMKQINIAIAKTAPKTKTKEQPIFKPIVYTIQAQPQKSVTKQPSIITLTRPTKTVTRTKVGLTQISTQITNILTPTFTTAKEPKPTVKTTIDIKPRQPKKPPPEKIIIPMGSGIKSELSKLRKTLRGGNREWVVRNPTATLESLKLGLNIFGKKETKKKRKK